MRDQEKLAHQLANICEDLDSISAKKSTLEVVTLGSNQMLYLN